MRARPGTSAISAFWLTCDDCRCRAHAGTKHGREEDKDAEQKRIRRALLEPQPRENLRCRVSHAEFPQSPFLLGQAARPTPANPSRRPPGPRQRRLPVALCSSRTYSDVRVQALVPKKREAPWCGVGWSWRAVSCEPMVQAWPTLPPFVLQGIAEDCASRRHDRYRVARNSRPALTRLR